MDETVFAGFGDEPTSDCGKQWKAEREHQQIDAGAGGTGAQDRLEVEGVEIDGPGGEVRVIE